MTHRIPIAPPACAWRLALALGLAFGAPGRPAAGPLDPLPVRGEPVALEAGAPVDYRHLEEFLLGRGETHGTRASSFLNTAVYDRHGGILIGGEFTSPSHPTIANFARILGWSASVIPDPTYNHVRLNKRVSAIANHVAGDGIYVAGAFDQVVANATLASNHRYAIALGHTWNGQNLTASLEQQLRPLLDAPARLMVEDRFPAGGGRRLLIGGDFGYAGPTLVSLFGRFDDTGTVQTTYGFGADNQVRAIATYPDGRILVGGMFRAPGALNRYGLVRFNPDGSRDPTFNANISGGTRRVNAIAIQPNGRILIGGNFQQVNGVDRANLARLNPDGSLDASFRLDTDNDVYSIAVTSNHSLVLGGSFTLLGGYSAGRLAAAAAVLDEWFVFPKFANGNVYGVTGTATGEYLVTGEFTKMDGESAPHLWKGPLVGAGGTEALSALLPQPGTVMTLKLQRGGAIPARTFFLRADPGGAFERIGEATLLSDGTLELADVPRPQGPGPYRFKAEFFFAGGHGNNSLSYQTNLSELQLAQHRISVNVNGQGSYSMGSPWVVNDEQRVIAVQPAASAYFGSISGCGVSGQFPTFITAPATGNCTIDIDLPPRSVSATVAGGLGQVTPPTQPVNAGGTVQFQVTPAPGHAISHALLVEEVAGTCPAPVIQGNTLVTGPVEAGRCGYEVHMQPIRHTVTPSVNGSGGIAPAQPVQVDHGATTQFTLAPAAGWQIGGVDGTCGGTLNGNVFTTAPVQSDCSVTARFEPLPVHLGLQVLPLAPWALYGQDFGYEVVLSNPAAYPVSGVSLASPIPDGADAPSVHWACLAPTGTGCTPTGSGALQQSGLTVPAGGSITWLVQGLVEGGSVLPRLQPAATAAHSPTGASASSSATILLALFRDGFDPGAADGAGDEPAAAR